MRLLLDTHLLLWSVAAPRKLPREARRLLESPANELFFSSASLWEITIKLGVRRSGLSLDPVAFLAALGDMGVEELPVRALHTLQVLDLPAVHKDPFDRLLVAQSRAEGMILLTNDTLLEGYGATVKILE